MNVSLNKLELYKNTRVREALLLFRSTILFHVQLCCRQIKTLSRDLFFISNGTGNTNMFSSKYLG